MEIDVWTDGDGDGSTKITAGRGILREISYNPRSKTSDLVTGATITVTVERTGRAVIDTAALTENAKTFQLVNELKDQDGARRVESDYVYLDSSEILVFTVASGGSSRRGRFELTIIGV